MICWTIFFLTGAPAEYSSNDPAQSTHHHETSSKHKSTLIHTNDMVLVKETHATDSVDNEPAPYKIDVEATKQQMMSLIKLYGFDEAIDILGGRVSLNLETPLTPEGREIIKESLIRTLFDFHLLHQNATIPGSHSQQQSGKSNLKRINERGIAATTGTTTITTTTPSPVTIAKPNQDKAEKSDKIVNTTPSQPITTTTPPPMTTTKLS